MRLLLASVFALSFLAQLVLCSSATGLELVQQYYLYRMECMVYGPDKTKLVGDNQRLPPADKSFGVKANEPVHPRPKGSAENGMLTFFEFERDLTDPDRVNPQAAPKKGKAPPKKYDVEDTTGGRMTTNPDGKLIGEKFLSWNRGATVPWRLATEIYDDVLADYQQKAAASGGKKVMPSYTGAQTAAKMGEILDKVRDDFDALPNKGAGLAEAFDNLFGKFKKNLDDGVAYRRLDNAEKALRWYEKEMNWPRADLVIEKVTLPDGRTFEDLNTDKTVAGFNGDAAKLEKWQKDTTALSGAPGKQRKEGNFRMVASHLSVIQAWQRVQSTARVTAGEC